MLPVVRRWFCAGGEDAFSEVKTCRSGEDCCGDTVDLTDVLFVMSLRNVAVFVSECSLIVDGFVLGEPFFEECFEELIHQKRKLRDIIPCSIIIKNILQVTRTK